MAYLDVISLDEAKVYLGIDDTSRDAEITAMIEGALNYIEERTNFIMVVQDKEYFLKNGCVDVFDTPINTLDIALPTTVTRERYENFSRYMDTNTENRTLILNVGGTSIPPGLKQAGLMLINFYFNDAETSREASVSLQNTMIPMGVQSLIGTYRRFII